MSSRRASKKVSMATHRPGEVGPAPRLRAAPAVIAPPVKTPSQVPSASAPVPRPRKARVAAAPLAAEITVPVTREDQVDERQPDGSSQNVASARPQRQAKKAAMAKKGMLLTEHPNLAVWQADAPLKRKRTQVATPANSTGQATKKAKTMSEVPGQPLTTSKVPAKASKTPAASAKTRPSSATATRDVTHSERGATHTVPELSESSESDSETLYASLQRTQDGTLGSSAKVLRRRTLGPSDNVIDPTGSDAEPPAISDDGDSEDLFMPDEDGVEYATDDDDDLGDLEEEPEYLGAQLQSEQPVWVQPRNHSEDLSAPSEMDSTQVSVGGGTKKGKNRVPRLQVEDWDEEMPRDAQGMEVDVVEVVDKSQRGKRPATRSAPNKEPPSQPTHIRELELPLWKDHGKPSKAAHASAATAAGAADADTFDQSDNEYADGVVDEEHKYDYSDDEDNPAGGYAITPPTQPGGVLSLTAQHPHIVGTVRRSFTLMERELLFVNAFPDAVGRFRFVAKAMQTAAGDLGHLGLKQCLCTDEDFLRALIPLTNQRASTFRGVVKKITDSSVVAFYELKPGQCTAKIDFLLEWLVYIYPHTFKVGDGQSLVSYAKPYQHNIVEHALRTCFFDGTHSPAAREAHRFSSVLDDRPDEKEVPLAMLALVATAIHASLTEWKSGAHKTIPFSADMYLDVYNEHVITLNGIKDGNGASGVPAPAQSRTKALAHVDIAGMDIDVDF
ncbi:hypothetical protein C8Q80DRAFT_1121117 [Daedaleopsis nitida]|nr:hypothetical protein C8Q80DRAFT_1121117 [Daedaleopsis nitida]